MRTITILLVQQNIDTGIPYPLPNRRGEKWRGKGGADNDNCMANILRKMVQGNVKYMRYRKEMSV